MKYFVFGDVHGFYKEFMSKLKKSGFDENNPDHMLVSLGDNFDRGPDNYKMFEFLKKMKNKNKIILIKGNHEDLIMRMIFSKKIDEIDYGNGTYGTMQEFSNKYSNHRDMFLKSYDNMYLALKNDGFFDLIYDMIDFYETDKYIFTHGYIPVEISNDRKSYKYIEGWRNADKELFRKSRWLNGMEIAEYHNIYEEGKKIVVGHWHASYGNVRKKYGFNLDKRILTSLEFSDFRFFNPYRGKNIIAIDACTVQTKKVNILVLED